MAPFPALPPDRPRGFPIDGHHALRHTGQRRHPGHETALELVRVERGEDVAQVVVGRRSIGERPEPAEKVELLFAEAGNIDEGIGTRQHREERQKQDLVQRIHDLAALARIGHFLEMIEKNYRLEERFAVRCRTAHDHPSLSESRGSS